MNTAASKFVAIANSIANTQGISWDAAWAQARTLNPHLYGEMSAGETRAPVAIANEAKARATRAQKEILAKVGETIARTGLDYTRAWRLVLDENPALANDLAGPNPPSKNPRSFATLGLPANASDTEWTTSFEANGRTMATRNSAAIWDALIQLAVREKGLTSAEAEAFAIARYPALAVALGKKTLTQP